MAVYWRQYIGDSFPRKPPIAPLTGGKLAKQSRVNAVIKAQDAVTGIGRRVIGAVSLQGANGGWFVPDTNPDAVSQTHPLVGDTRQVATVTGRLTPGHMPRLSILCIPSGETQIFVGSSNYDPGGPQGSVSLAVTWYYPESSVSTSHQISLPASGLLYGAAPTDPWPSINVIEVPIMTPDNIGPMVEMWRHSRHSELSVTVSLVNSPRIIDVVLSETPYYIAREADDASDQWVSHMLAQQEVGGPGSVDWPYQRLSETTPDGDPRGGTWHTSDVAEAQHLRLGPQLVHWHAWDEDEASPTSTTTISVSSTSSTFAMLWLSSQSTYDPDLPGLSLSCGAYARGYSGNHPYWARSDGAIPVLIAVRAQGDTVTGTVRVQSSDSHYYDMALTTTASWAWYYGYTWARVGRGPGQPTNCQIFTRRDSGANGFEVSDVVIHHSGQYAPLH